MPMSVDTRSLYPVRDDRSLRRALSVCVAGILLLGLATVAAAQGANPLRVDAPPVVVTAEKEPADAQTVPASITAVPADTLSSWAISSISDATPFTPNTFFSEFQARKLSFARFRGISSGPGNPAITTYVDGVPLLHTNISNIELIDVAQIELVRGGQSALFGRNALGGVVNVSSVRPSFTKWTGSATVPLGNYSSWGARGAISGPISSHAAISLAAGRAERDGFTKDVVSGTPVDSRGSTFGKAQFLWLPTPSWETRVIVSGERARDGDYALADLGSLRATPYRTYNGCADAERDCHGPAHGAAPHASGNFAGVSAEGRCSAGTGRLEIHAVTAAISGGVSRLATCAMQSGFFALRTPLRQAPSWAAR